MRNLLLKPDAALAASVARPAFTLKARTPIHEALASMRAASLQLAVVMNGADIAGVVTLADILRRVLPTSSATETRKVT